MLAPRTELPPNHISIQALRSKSEQLPVKSFDRPVVVPYTKHRPNYFHWLFDGIGRLQLLEKAGHDLSEFCYVFREPLTSWQRDTLRGIEVPLDKCHTFEWFDFRVDRMVVLPCPWNRRRYSVSNMNWMRERFRGAYCDPELEARPANRKIFIKRRDSEGRSILNRSELMPLIKEAGFEAVYLSDLTFPQQVRLFARADVILGAHGAGLANMVFSDDAQIVEIFFGERPMFYWLMARSRGFEYQWIDATVSAGRGEQRPNGTLDRSELRAVLSKAL
ncbi:glycosyltransferase family 61 protein [Salinibacter ruber]|uniref:glycosyltransferase family 61 protein n=1 Tax=Salinibacter ruber TaxID=146919 RepID=UPI0021673062|nr:glycosyltransferase family 61 protein [Salinibacter ruber]